MELNRISVPDEVIGELAKHYKDLITKTGQARVVHGENSNEYALALALVTATVTAIQFAYGFESAKQAHAFLRLIVEQRK